MNTFRLLFWLRWRLAMNMSTTKNRWTGAALIVLLLLAFSPFYAGGAVVAWKAAHDQGRGAVLVVFGLVQLIILWVSLLTGAMGRTFELDKLKRYPLQPLGVFVANTAASVTEPIVLMTLPSLVAVAIGVGQHDGVDAGLATAAGAALLLLVTLAMIQLLLAILDDLLRREWMRYLAAFLFTATLIGFQLTLSRVSSKLVQSARAAGLSPELMAAQARKILGAVPTVAAPASVAGTHPAGLFGSPWMGLAGALALIIVPILIGARVMDRAALRPAIGAVGGKAGRELGLSLTIPGLTPVQGLLLGRELVYLLRTPGVLFQMLIIPLMVIALSFIHARDGSATAPSLPLFVLVSGLAGRNLMMWAHDGPGVRTLFLMPFTPRDLVLTKYLSWLITLLIETVVAFGVLSALHPATFLPEVPMYLTGYLAVALVAGVIGMNVSIRQPVKAPERGMGRRSPGGLVGLGGFLAVMATVLAIALMVMAARAITPVAYDRIASVAVTSAALGIALAIAWISLDRTADLLEQQREHLIDVLTKTADA